jgi:hypothetical protein
MLSDERTEYPDEYSKYPKHDLLNSLRNVTKRIAGIQDNFPELEPEFIQVQESVNRLAERIEQSDTQAIENLNRYLDDKRQSDGY